jgi:hypothetical protein
VSARIGSTAPRTISRRSSNPSRRFNTAPAGQLYIRAVFGFARADFLPSDLPAPEWHNYMYSGRVRLLYIY